MLTPWFKRRRGFALSLAFNGASLGGVLFLPLWVALIEAMGLTPAAVIVAAATLTLLWWLAGRYLRPTPAALGLLPDGDDAVDVAAAAEAAAIDLPPLTRGQLLRHGGFLALASAFALGLFSQVGLIAHLVSLLVPMLGEAGAPGAASATATCAVIGRLLLGAVIDRLDARRAAAGNFALQALGFGLLLSGGGALAALAGCILFGLGLGNLVSLPPLIIEREFAPATQGRAVALAVAVSQAAYSFAPAIFGALHDAAGSYAAPLALALALHVAAAALVLIGGGEIRVRAAPGARAS